MGVGSTLNGAGVTFYFTQRGGSSFGAIVVGRGNTASNYLNLTAPTDNSAGGTPSILFWIDPAWTGTDPAAFTNCVYTGSGGVIYSKKAGIAFTYSSLLGGYYFAMDVAYYTGYLTPHRDSAARRAGAKGRCDRVVVRDGRGGGRCCRHRLHLGRIAIAAQVGGTGLKQRGLGAGCIPTITSPRYLPVTHSA